MWWTALAGYVRFVIPRLDADSGAFEGLFSAAGKLRDHGELADYEQDSLDECLGWFRKNLPVPDCFKHPGAGQAICWFRDDAVESLQYAREIVRLLREHGETVDMLSTTKPGRIIHRDQWQIVAKPFRETGAS